MVYRDFAFLGSESFAAAEAANCAKSQGKFWAYHDTLYATEHKDGAENNGNLNRNLFISIAKSLSLNLSEFEKCIDTNQYDEQIKKEIEAGRLAGVKGTPALFLNGDQIGGFIDFKTLQADLETPKAQ